MVASPLLPHIGNCLALASRPDAALDSEVELLAKRFIAGSQYNGCSDAALAAVTGVDRFKVKRTCTRLASATCLLDRMYQADLEKALAQTANVTVLEYIEGNRYDETPLGMKIKRDIELASGIANVDELIASQTPVLQRDLQVVLPGLRSQFKSSPVPRLKVFQTEATVTMVLKIADGDKVKYACSK